VLVDSEGLSSDGGLIDLEEGIFGDDAAIRRNDGTLFDLQDIAGNDLGGLNLLEGAVTEDNSLEGESPETGQSWYNQSGGAGAIHTS
jgi:hypothetical protein